MQSLSQNPANRCHFCGATSYHPAIARDDKGQLRPQRQVVCDGCGKVFDDVQSWRLGHGGSVDGSAGKSGAVDGNFEG
jgi:hypothetical protein